MSPAAERMKVEVLFDSPLADAVIEVVSREGGAGYTLFSAIGGAGRNGRWTEDRLSSADSKLLLMTIVPADTARSIVGALEPLLDSHGMIVMTSAVAVVRKDRF